MADTIVQVAQSRRFQHRPPPDAMRQAQIALALVDHIVLVFPIWNGAMPALLKGFLFLEQTFRSSFIFPDARRDERLGFSSDHSQRKVLTGTSARVVATMQMPGFVYRWFFHPHLEKNTLKVGGVSPIRETFVGLWKATASGRSDGWVDAGVRTARAVEIAALFPTRRVRTALHRRAEDRKRLARTPFGFGFHPSEGIMRRMRMMPGDRKAQ